ncbi:histone-lysine N-methyltransferase MEDEA [Raphanus sativus]|uniref:[histone H3]-lysine(27) N-trimethyltransferase n=1 Tax=Raphanus sativus TaxID=3726 RepID=A0A6J0P0R4_RAPSA|nr:histone-lysine N-methyltransferase MEDEA [Raphanus sativus]
MLSLRMETPLHIFKYNPSEEFTSPNPKKQDINIPIVKQLPRAITWVLTDSNKPVAESDFVIGKKQIIYVNGQAEELSSGNEEDEEEIKKENLEFSKDADRFIWEVGQKNNLDDLVVKSALSKFFKLDVSSILERFNELKKLKVNEGDIGEASEIRMFTSFPETPDKHFCRRCLRFDCREHEEYQPEIYTKENQSNLFEREDVRKQCSNHCYLKLKGVIEADHMMDNDNSTNKKGKNMVSEMSQAYNEWTPVEMDLYLKGAKLFGRNSCLIARNVLTGLKTCLDVYNYMHKQDQCNMLLEYQETSETDNQVNKDTSQKKRRLGRKKAQLQKHICYPAAIKNTMNKIEKSYKHYTPCTCEPVCGDQCPCFRNGNCCEIYCGCPKTCNNRFGGCNCKKGQCINGKCPCFSNSRECNPDLCRSCSLSCGDGSLGETSKTSKCKNMQFLLKKHKKILLGISGVHGWGAFTRHSLKQNEYLGEYTGELVSIDEAEERQRADDKLGYSYLFNLNDKFVIDSRRQGNKFRFLNNSSHPNCYAKLMTVKGDQKIGLFAGKAIREGEELFFKYKPG